MKTLGGCMFVYNGDKFDYCYRECIESMKAVCDEVSIVAIESEDGCHEVCKTYSDFRTIVTVLPESEWLAQHGKQKLAYFQNVAKDKLNTDYQLLVQADEVLHESSFPAIRRAISYGLPAYIVERVNLWFNPWRKLTVPQHRKPCSSEVIRIALKEFDSVDDGENIGAHNVCFDFLDEIRIYHMGFVRSLDVMKEKVIHMQESVFETPHDARLDEDKKFNPDRYFDYVDDSKDIDEPLPKFVQKWAEDRWK